MTAVNFLSHFYLLFLAVSASAFIVTIYHCIVVICQNRHDNSQVPQSTVARLQNILLWRSRQEPQGPHDTGLGLENSKIELIPKHKYEKGKGIVDAECAVCLSEFEEGEDIRTLSECMHSFHVPCIDMWLYSHPSCPICRANASPSLQMCHSSDDVAPPRHEDDLTDLEGGRRGLENRLSETLATQHLSV